MFTHVAANKTGVCLEKCCCFQIEGIYLGGGNSNIFHRYFGKMKPFWRAYFSKGLVQPPTSCCQAAGKGPGVEGSRLLGDSKRNRCFPSLSKSSKYLRRCLEAIKACKKEVGVQTPTQIFGRLKLIFLLNILGSIVKMGEGCRSVHYVCLFKCLFSFTYHDSQSTCKLSYLVSSLKCSNGKTANPLHVGIPREIRTNQVRQKQIVHLSRMLWDAYLNQSRNLLRLVGHSLCGRVCRHWLPLNEVLVLG